jgi:hypothetical protein
MGITDLHHSFNPASSLTATEPSVRYYSTVTRTHFMLIYKQRLWLL